MPSPIKSQFPTLACYALSVDKLNPLNLGELLVVGSGFYGLTLARLAAESGFSVQIIDKRAHLGGNAHSFIDAESGVEVHKYGSHLFHTSNKRVWDFVNRFTGFNDYRHTVKTVHNGEVFSMPINLGTISQFYRRHLSPSEAQELINTSSNNYISGENFESKALSQIGPELYEAFIQGYTEKQWQVEPSKLPGSTFSRLPIRFDFNDRYFSDKWEGLPLLGYFGLIEAIADHPNIQVDLEVDYFSHKDWIRDSRVPVVFTGPLDQYFGNSFGRLGWRTLDFEFETLQIDDFQGTSVVNYADHQVPYTRIHEFKHLHPERKHRQGLTTIAFEFSRWSNPDDEPYYPVNSPADREALLAYRELARREENVFFGGRLGSYQYLDMHMAIASAITSFETELNPILLSRRLN